MNLAVVPYHDWRKILIEGGRTRDAHFINCFQELYNIEKLIIINRPITFPELLIKKRLKKIVGKVLLSKNGCRLVQLDEKSFVIDFISKDFINHIILKRDWYFNAYKSEVFISFIKDVYNYLGIKDISYVSHNIYSSFLFEKLKPKELIFDAWDNYARFPFSDKHLNKLKYSYHAFAKYAKKWTTNSSENKVYYEDNYNVKNIHIIKNGVDLSKFQSSLITKPHDFKNIPTPIIGFGGKITHLFDVDLFNYLLEHNKDKSFVIVGQIIDKKKFKLINKSSNFYYLGDKHYDIYPLYVQAFDICLIPYLVGEKAHGGDSIKAYEYLATGKKTVGTIGNGLIDLKKYLYLHEDYSLFSKELSNLHNGKKTLMSEKFSWIKKAKSMINILEERL
tara:strand:- start:1583 stop:2755 length:1173 start_codon:yes stop_codon:yes gene_type:complete